VTTGTAAGDGASGGHWRRAAPWLLRLAFLAVVAVAIGRDFDTARFASALRAAGIVPLIACFGVDTVFVMTESFRLLVLSQARYPFGLIVRSRYLSMLVGNLLPGLTAGDLVRVFLIDRARPGNKAGILVLLLGNRFYGLLSLASLGIVALSQPAGASLRARAHGWGPVIAVGVAALTAPLWARLPQVQRACAALLRRLPAVVAGAAWRAFEAILGMTSVRQWLFAVVTCTLTNLLVVCQFWILSRALAAGVSFGGWCLIVPFVALATMLPLGIGAVGTQEAALFAASRLAGARFEPLLLVSFAMHIVRIGGSLPGLAFFGDLALTIRQLRASRSRSPASPSEGAP
jgi:hypothetical protein